MGEATAELCQALVYLQNKEASLRLAYQTYLANFLLERGYLEPANFLVRFTEIPQTIVIADDYRISVKGAKHVKKINCHA